MVRRSGVNLEMVNTVLLVVILILVIYCCLRNNNEGFFNVNECRTTCEGETNEDVRRACMESCGGNNGNNGGNNGGPQSPPAPQSGPDPCEIKCSGTHERGTESYRQCVDNCYN